MITTPTWLSIPTAGGTASISTTGLNMSSLYLPNTLLPAEHLNYFLNGFSNNSNVSETAMQNVLLEMQNLVTGIGFTLDPTDNTQLEKADIARKHTVGELVWFEMSRPSDKQVMMKRILSANMSVRLPLICTLRRNTESTKMIIKFTIDSTR